MKNDLLIHKNRFRFIIFLIIISSGIYAQQFTISGVVLDSLSGETLVGANIMIYESKKGVSTNRYGFYSISLPIGTYNIFVSYMGYKTFVTKQVLTQNMYMKINLKELKSELKEIQVSAKKSNIENSSVSINNINIERIKSIATAAGEPDVFKSLQLLPGIQSVNEGASNLYIRGGSHDQNLILLDEAPVYNPMHSLGFFSTFNTDAIKNVSVYKGAFPSQYGGRLSSVIDIAMREGNYNQSHLSAGVGLTASRLTIESPIVKEKVSFILSGRYSYSGQTLNLFGGAIGSDILGIHSLRNFNNKNNIWFYDLNAKINYRINDNNHVFFSTYSGFDKFYCYTLNNENDLEWGNTTTTLRWNHVFTNKLFSNFTLYNSNYKYAYSINEDIRNFIWKSDIKETGIKADFTYYLNKNNNVMSGFSCIQHIFSPGSIEPKDSTSIVIPIALDTKRSIESAIYIGSEQGLANLFTVNYGLRYSLFLNYGPAIIHSYNKDMSAVTGITQYAKGELINHFYSFEPRISINYKINESNALKTAYTYTKQYLHLLSNSTVGLPTDTWLPPDKYIKPQSSHQYVIGFYKTFRKSTLELSVESYYKSLINIVDFKDNAQLFLNKYIETQILQGKGRSYGVEFLLEKKSGKLSGWIGYTLAKTQYKIEGINNNKYYSPRYDIRHNLTFTGSLELNKLWNISSTFKLASGGFITLPQQVFYVDGAAFFDYTGRNNYALPAYHRLDLSAVYSNPKNQFRRLKSQWIFSIYNVYNHKNIYSLFVKQNSSYTLASAYKMYLFGVVPTISYNIKI